MEFVLTPLTCIGPFSLGARRAELRDAVRAVGFELHSERGSSDYFAKVAIQVEYDDAGCAWFIGANSTPQFRLLFHGIDLFDTDATEVFELFCQSEGGPAPPYGDGGYTFPKQIVTLWEADEQYDRVREFSGGRSRPIWGQIGVGSAGYLTAIRNGR